MSLRSSILAVAAPAFLVLGFVGDGARRDADTRAASPAGATQDANGAEDESADDAGGRELRVEYFVLWTRVTSGGAASRPEVAGFVEWRKRDTGHGPQMECDVRFLRASTTAGGVREVERVLHVERLTDTGPRCVWREIGPGSGRSVQAEWSQDGRALDLSEWSAAGKRRGTLVAAGGASMPLYLVELLRGGGLASGEIVRFDPLARTLEVLDVRTVWLDDDGPLAREVTDVDPSPDLPDGAEKEGAADDSRATSSPTKGRASRTVELVRADGTLAGRYRFAGHDLVAFQWQEGPLFARAVSPDEYTRLETEHAPSTRATRER